jgi:pyruvate carboxylase subunit B
VVRRGGFATSVTPVSQFYFQQAYANVTQGKWKKITQGYGDMVLGYFGRTPVQPDPEIVALAAEQLGKKPFDGDPFDLLEPARPKMEKLLTEKGIEVTDENVFIAHACGDKGVDFLLGKFQVNVRKNESAPVVANTPAAVAPAPAVAAPVAPVFNPSVVSPNPQQNDVSGNVRAYRVGVGGHLLDVQVQDA